MRGRNEAKIREGASRRKLRCATLVLVVGLMVVFGRTALLTRLFLAERAAADRAAIGPSAHGHDVIRHGRKHLAQNKVRRLAFAPLEVDDDGDDDGDDDCLCNADALPCVLDLAQVPSALPLSRATTDRAVERDVFCRSRGTFGARAPPSAPTV
jgi:hypothetical protein